MDEDEEFQRVRVDWPTHICTCTTTWWLCTAVLVFFTRYKNWKTSSSICEYDRLNSLIKNWKTSASCEYDRLNSWNSTLQGAWYIRSVFHLWCDVCVLNLVVNTQPHKSFARVVYFVLIMMGLLLLSYINSCQTSRVRDHTKVGFFFFFFFLLTLYFPASGQSRGHRCRPFFPPPPVLAFNFYRA